jgi:hypothetical protein
MGDSLSSACAIALSIDLIVDHIASFLGVHFAHSTLRHVSRFFFSVTELALRARSARLLTAVLPVPGGKYLAGRIEEALYRGCGRRAGPGAYNDRLKALSSAFKANNDLVRGASCGALAPAALASMAGSPRALQTRAAAAEALAAEAALGARAELPPPRPPDVVGLQVCPRCGCDRLWRTLVLRAGVRDVNRATDSLVCCACKAEVLRDGGGVALALAAAALQAATGRGEDAGGSVGGWNDSEGSEGDGDATCLFLTTR